MSDIVEQAAKLAYETMVVESSEVGEPLEDCPWEIQTEECKEDWRILVRVVLRLGREACAKIASDSAYEFGRSARPIERDVCDEIARAIRERSS